MPRPQSDKGGFKRPRFFRRRACRFCMDPEIKIDYKDPKFLNSYITDRGKVIPRRITSNCAYHQREVTTAIKRARILALLSFTATQARW